jgi:hypothetical protein
MARLRGHRTLDLSKPLYVRRADFTIAGRSFKAGDVLPWPELGITERKLHQLWFGRRIGHEQANERNGAESPVELVRLPVPSLTVEIDTSSPSPAAGPAATTSPEQAARPATEVSSTDDRPPTPTPPPRPHNHKRR